jgi:maleylacetate reductase
MDTRPRGVMLQFQLDLLPARVVFGLDSLHQVKAEVARLGKERALVLSTPPQRDLAEQVAALLGELSAGVYDQAVMHVPVETVNAAAAVCTAVQADVLVAAGGGSTIGLAKGLTLRNRLPIIAIPTTYAGSEMTPIWGLSEGGYKTTGRDPLVKPVTVIYDPKLTLTLPPQLVITSAMNSIAHCVEALYAENANPIASLMAEEGVRALAQSIPVVLKQPTDLEARANAQYGCWLGGTVLGMVGMALHHKLCHTLGGSFNLPHAETHTVILPHATHYNRGHAPQAMTALARVFSCPVADVAGRLWDLANENGAPTSLAELGFQAADLDRAVELATRNPYYNPRPVTSEGIRAILEDALAGRRP